MARRPAQRCAVYTRKSSEEGLEQDFNSLHAQREACEAYIESQKQEGWTVLREAYDDGGYSGGTMERPGLQRLLQAVQDGSVDVIVVYKVDRLTRSLADFAKIVEAFDARGVSFVSVTQPFNTTSSMGRLTLNVLLSFAQFEREVTGERIRDKITASKQKGMWMGGHVPVGYRAEERSLVVKPGEAETVRTLFRLYRDYGCVRRVRAEAERLGLTTKAGGAFSRGHIYRVLANPIYIGRIPHHETSYPGNHAAIIDADLWQGVQDRLTDNRVARRQLKNAKEPSLLAGKLFAADGTRYTPSHTNKQGKRYRYYIENTSTPHEAQSKPQRIPADEIERIVLDGLGRVLTTPQDLIDAIDRPELDAPTANAIARAAKPLNQALQDPKRRTEIVRHLVAEITLDADTISVALDRSALRQALDIDDDPSDEQASPYRIDIPVQIRRRGVEQRFVIHGGNTDDTGQVDQGLIKALLRAHDWWARIRNGTVSGPAAIAAIDGVQSSYVSRLLPLAFLAPDITEAILDGKAPVDLTLDWLTKQLELPIEWDAQRRLLGFPRR